MIPSWTTATLGPDRSFCLTRRNWWLLVSFGRNLYVDWIFSWHQHILDQKIVELLRGYLIVVLLAAVVGGLVIPFVMTRRQQQKTRQLWWIIQPVAAAQQQTLTSLMILFPMLSLLLPVHCELLAPREKSLQETQHHRAQAPRWVLCQFLGFFGVRLDTFMH